MILHKALHALESCCRSIPLLQHFKCCPFLGKFLDPPLRTSREPLLPQEHHHKVLMYNKWRNGLKEKWIEEWKRDAIGICKFGVRNPNGVYATFPERKRGHK
ncbi:unnamed protein product [Prunus armeniaca]